MTKLLTEDLPRLFVRPKKIVLDFQKGEAVGPVPTDLKSKDAQEKNKDSVGELSVTLVDARNLSYVLYGMIPSILLNIENLNLIRSLDSLLLEFCSVDCCLLCKRIYHYTIQVRRILMLFCAWETKKYAVRRIVKPPS